MDSLSSQPSVLRPQSSFGDDVAERFERFRGLPDAIADRIRDRIVAATGLGIDGRVLDLGAGTGRLTRPFLQAGYPYAGIDTSSAMLARLTSLPNAGPRADCVRASATGLPFATGVFDVILAVQVLGIVPDWLEAVRECRRVLRPGGWVILGRQTHDRNSLPSLVRRARLRILGEWGIETGRPGAEEAEAAEALAAEIGCMTILPSLTWRIVQRPREAILANLSGWRVAALPDDLRKRLHEHLAQTIRQELGDLDTPHVERAAFSLRCFRRPP